MHWADLPLKQIECALYLPGILRVCFFSAPYTCFIWKTSRTWRIQSILLTLHPWRQCCLVNTRLGPTTGKLVFPRPWAVSFALCKETLADFCFLLSPSFHIPHTYISAFSDVTGCRDKCKGTITLDCCPWFSSLSAGHSEVLSTTPFL